MSESSKHSNQRNWKAQPETGPSAAILYEQAGFRIVPVAAGGKKPRVGGFGKNNPTFTVRAEDFKDTDRAAILTGATPAFKDGSKLLCIDEDGTLSAESWAVLGPLPPTLTSHNGKHRWYRVAPTAASAKLAQWTYVLFDDTGSLDLKWDGGYAAEDGDWDHTDGPQHGRSFEYWLPERIAMLPDSAVQKLVELGTAAPPVGVLVRALASAWPKPGGGCHKAALALGGVIGRSTRRAEIDVDALCAELFAATGTTDRTADVRDSLNAIDAGRTAYGLPELSSLLGDSTKARRAIALLKRFVGRSTVTAKLENEGWIVAEGLTGVTAHDAGDPERWCYTQNTKVPRHVRIQALCEIAGRHPDLYRRGASIVEVRGGAAHKLQASTLMTQLSRCATFYGNAAGAGLQQSDPPGYECSELTTARVWDSDDPVRELRGIARAPFLAPGGRVVSARGYDAESKWLLTADALEIEPLPEAPSLADAQRALIELCEPWSEFPWVASEHILVPVAVVLTALARAAIDGPVPCFAFNASDTRSGKTEAVQAAVRIASGAAAAPCGWSTSEAEREKTLCASAVEAPQFLMIDNIGRNRILGGDSLERTITSDPSVGIEFRVLGVSEKARYPWTTVVVATGNNMVFNEDLIGRTIACRLEKQTLGVIEQRRFKCHPLGSWVLAHRARLVRAALIVLRAHALANPPRGKALAGFDAWSRVVADALQWASGGWDIRQLTPSREQVDAGVEYLDRVIAGLPRSAADAKTSKELLEHRHATGEDSARTLAWFEDLRNAAGDKVVASWRDGRPSGRWLTEFLAQQKDRLTPAGRVRSFQDAKTKITRFWCEGATA